MMVEVVVDLDLVLGLDFEVEHAASKGKLRNLLKIINSQFHNVHKSISLTFRFIIIIIKCFER